MPFPIVIEVQGTAEDFGLSVREWRRALKASHEAEGRYWRRELLPRHFTPAAKGRYHHQPRRRGYLLQKLRRARIGQVKEGGQVDNVFSGTLRQFMLETAVVRAFPTRVTITMAGPRYIGMVPRDPGKPDKAREILTVNADERDELRGVQQRTLDDAIDAHYLQNSAGSFKVDAARSYTGGPGGGYSTAFFTAGGD